MRADDLLAIDVSAEVETLCTSQLQGAWQIPAELVRLASARGAPAVAIERVRHGLRIAFEGPIASRRELEDLVVALDNSVGHDRRQEAVSRIDAVGAEVLLWIAGRPGSRLSLQCRSGADASHLQVRRGHVELALLRPRSGPASTEIRWWCSLRERRRAVAWLRTALRFVPIPVTVLGLPVERGFRDGLYRMRIAHPLPGELAVTRAGDVPTLWLLENGVLSTRAVVPGYPAFSAAVEMSAVVPLGASGARLRSAVTPYLPDLIDQAVHMLVLLAERVPMVDDRVRQRLTILLLRSAIAGIRKDEIVSVPVIPVRTASGRQFESVRELARRADEHGGVVTGGDGGGSTGRDTAAPYVEAGPEELALFAELSGCRVERRTGGRRPVEIGHRVVEACRTAWWRLRSLLGPRPVPSAELSEAERRLVDRAADAGVELAMTPGRGGPRRSGHRWLLGRDRSEVAAASFAVSGDDAWLYPALLAIAGDQMEIPQRLRERWIDVVVS